MSVRRLHSVARFAVIRESIGAHVGKIADAVEVHDPSGILTLAEDLPDGSGVRLGLAAAGVASPTPDLGVGISVPLRDVAGRRVTSVGDYGIDGYLRALVGTDPARFAIPSGMQLWVAYLADGPLSTAQHGFASVLLNNAAGRWRARQIKLMSGTWGAPSDANATAAGTMGCHGTWASANPNNPGQAWTCSTAVIPHGGANTGPFQFNGFQLSGADPHLAFGVGWATVPGAADEVSFSALAHLSLPDPT